MKTLDVIAAAVPLL